MSSPDILHNKLGVWDILLGFCAKELVLSQSLCLINPDGESWNCLI